MAHAVPCRPVGEGLQERPPGGLPRPVGDGEVRDRLAEVVAESRKTRRQMPARLQGTAFARAAIEREDQPLARPCGVKGDLQAVAEEPARAAVMVGLGGRQQVHEGGVARQHRAHQGVEALVGEGQSVLQLGDERLLGGEDTRGRGNGKAPQKRRVAGDLRIVRICCAETPRVGGGAYRLHPVGELHPRDAARARRRATAGKGPSRRRLSAAPLRVRLPTLTGPSPGACRCVTLPPCPSWPPASLADAPAPAPTVVAHAPPFPDSRYTSGAHRRQPRRGRLAARHPRPCAAARRPALRLQRSAAALLAPGNGNDPGARAGQRPTIGGFTGSWRDRAVDDGTQRVCLSGRSGPSVAGGFPHGVTRADTKNPAGSRVSACHVGGRHAREGHCFVARTKPRRWGGVSGQKSSSSAPPTGLIF